jgi:hypothetical protein
LTAVRKAVAIAVVILSGVLGGSESSAGSRSLAAIVLAPPSGLAVRPDVVDPDCNGGRGLTLAAHLGEIPVVASAALPDGSTLIAVSSAGSPTKRSVIVYSVTATCRPNPSFGEAGVATLGPAQPAPKDPGGVLAGLQIDAVAPANGGGAFLGGSYGGRWIVGKVTAHGQPDPSFGHDGWSLLPFGDEVESVLQEPSGQVVIGASSGGGCCVRNWMAALSPTGALDAGFGTGGRDQLPTGEDSGVGAPVLEPNGDILAVIGYGNMGCWGTSLEMLTPSGRPVPLFQQRLTRFWQAIHLGAFVGDVYADGAGFTVIGTGQEPCYQAKPAPSATGLIARFTADGQQVGQTIRFPSRMFGNSQAFPEGDGTLVAESPYANSTQLTIKALRSDGSLDTAFASHGVAVVRTPWRGQNAALQTMVSISEAVQGTIVIVAQDGGNQLQLTRLDV